MAFEIKRGLDIPINGEPVQQIKVGATVTQVALIGDDYIGMRPRMLVQVGDKVKLGQAVFEDKKTEGVIYTAPGAGTVSAINRGAKRKFESLVIDLEGDAAVDFGKVSDLGSLNAESATEKLTKSGLWSAFRTRPYNRVPVPAGPQPSSIFVTATDTNPLAAEPELIIAEHRDEFVAGLNVVTKLCDGKTFVCTRGDSRVPGNDIPETQFEVFEGPHPAGLPGTHIHMLDPVGTTKTVWFIGYQDVIAIGHLFTTGKLMTERTIAISGPKVENPGLFKTRLGAKIVDVVAGKVDLKDTRLISGSILSGRTATPPTDFLGRYHIQVTALTEGNFREFLGWQGPGLKKFSITNIYVGGLLSRLRGKKFDMNTNLNGSHRGMVPVETYERVMPLKILPTYLLRALISGDTETAQRLGCLELDEDDLALCTYVCPGKYDYGQILRENLATIEKEG